ncbi:hypothetical protein TIFTF001_009320 [Ficus carica]|uniref:Uncharacterized protein n=1 Tax=Ficus carica TaxID=3494 RepID=A0AA88AA78_FICCA|nr:hypothetical protein TIFTF001_009320 [Ficus carica]
MHLTHPNLAGLPSPPSQGTPADGAVPAKKKKDNSDQQRDSRHLRSSRRSSNFPDDGERKQRLRSTHALEPSRAISSPSRSGGGHNPLAFEIQLRNSRGDGRRSFATADDDERAWVRSRSTRNRDLVIFRERS